MNTNDFVASLLPHHKENWRKIIKALHDHVVEYNHSEFLVSKGWDHICVGSIACKLGIVNLIEDDYNGFLTIIEDEDLFGENASDMVFNTNSKFAQHVNDKLNDKNFDIEAVHGDVVADLLESWLGLKGLIADKSDESEELYVTVYWKGGRYDRFPSKESITQFLALNPERKVKVKKVTITKKVPHIVYNEVESEYSL